MIGGVCGVEREMHRFMVGDRFYFFKNNTDSETLKVGYKGVAYECYKHYLTCGEFGEWAFDYDEIKPIIRIKNGVVCE